MERVEVIEQVIIIVATASLFPFVFGFREPWYVRGLLSLVAVTMLTILIRKWRRFNRALEEARAQLAEHPPAE